MSRVRDLQNSHHQSNFLAIRPSLADNIQNHCPENAKRIGHQKPYSADPIRIPYLKATKKKEENESGR